MDTTIITAIAGLCMAVLVIFIRLRASKKPVSARKIILPPIFMSTGFSMFLYPPMHVHIQYAIAAFFVGTLFSYPLVLTSKFEQVGEHIYLRRSKWFIVIILGLFTIRFALKTYVGLYINTLETAGLFFILAFGMIVPWRIAMYFGYMKVKQSGPAEVSEVNMV